MHAQGMKVLVVEDDADLSQTIATALQSAGYDVTTVHNGRDAAFRLKNVKYSCILLDMNLRGEPGENVIQLAKNGSVSANVKTPILVISANLDKDRLIRIAPQIRGALVKPFQLGPLLEQVGKACAGRG